MKIRGSSVVPTVTRRAATLLFLAGALATPAHAQVNIRGRGCDAISVSSPDKPRVRDRFSATKTLDLQFRMRMRNVDKEPHVVTFRVLTPKGHLYQEIQVIHRPDSRRPVTTLSAGLPLAGTAIATNTLYGRWRVTPYLDGSSRPCNAAAVFSIVK